MIKKIDAESLVKPRKVEIDNSVQKFRKNIYNSMKTYYNTFHYTKEG